ncbi:MAG: GTP-binding protein [Candidatus Lokiarchaeota archaeon]|nr:GTP-binding protein [Candidatus Lokiarchaeota archaeon]
MDEREFYFKIVVIGDSAVGKTSLIFRYTTGTFNQEYIMTLGTQISKFQATIDGISTKLVFWDLAGQATFEHLRKNFYNGTSAAIIVFSHEENELGEKSFNNCVKWYNDVIKYCGNIPVILFGNKIDLIDYEMLSKDLKNPKSDQNMMKLAKDLKMSGYYKTSALTGQGVAKAFVAIISELVNEREKHVPML